MEVSHYLVSWIQVSGLIVGLYGFFFLTIPIFGDGTIRWFRALLPAAAVGLGYLVALAQPGRQLLPSWLLWVSVVGAATAAYSASSQKTVRRYWFAFGWAIVGLVLVLDGIFIVSLLAHQSGTDTIPNILSVNIGGLLAGCGYLLIVLLPRILGEKGLLKLGVLLSGLAILTQFLPPVLDLLNISIR